MQLILFISLAIFWQSNGLAYIGKKYTSSLFNATTKCVVLDDLGMENGHVLVIHSDNAYAELNWYIGGEHTSKMDGHYISDSTDYMAKKINLSSGFPVSGFIFYSKNDNDAPSALRILIEQEKYKKIRSGFLIATRFYKNDDSSTDEDIVYNEHINCRRIIDSYQ